MPRETEPGRNGAAEPAFFQTSHYLIRGIDLFTEWTGRVIGCLAVLMVGITGAVVVMRRAFGLNAIELQESAIYMHAAYLRGVAPPGIATADIHRGVLPLIVIQLLVLVVLAVWPHLATWLPGQL